MNRFPDRHALIVVEQPERSARIVATWTDTDRCAMAVTKSPSAELRRLSARMLGRLLEQDGFLSEVIVGANAAVRQLDGRRPLSLLVIDAGPTSRRMRRVVERARAACPIVPIVLITSEQKGERSWIEPPVVVLQKPVHYAELAAVARDVALSRMPEGVRPTSPECSTRV